ncbi:MAG TPA: plastocyanin/azurin family copper-binding protein [Chloroflexota bacterium]|nr:plastocyanin/azurin family copper-binding protein [Chloroflexota bacterium]
MLVLAAGLGPAGVPRVAAATIWRDTAGAQTGNEAIQALAFLPNELWIHTGDTINWSFPTGEPHTLTLVTPFGTDNNSPQICNGASTSPPTNQCTWDGSSVVNSGRLQDGGTFAVAFPVAPHDYIYRCLIHSRMTGTIHVEPTTTTLLHDQKFYDQEGQQQSNALLTQGNQLRAQEQAQTVAGPGRNAVTIGAGFVTGTAPGLLQAVSVNRFLPGNLTVRQGDTVTWSANDPAIPHTVTFGAEPANLRPAIGTPMLNAPYPQPRVGPTVSAGFLGQGQPSQTYSVTFNAPVTYQYYCALHDDLGMLGTVIVVPRS